MNDVLQVLQERFLLQKEFLGDEKPINKVQPLVSVSVPTYQHSRYISECLDGILMQQTSFPIEIIIGEDGSTDGTREICEEYAIKHQDKIRLFNRDRKLSQYVDKEGHVTRFNGIWNRMSARGKYIAMCEGDDYWIDPSKLQKQVCFLENNPEHTLCFHNAKIIYGNKELEQHYRLILKDTFYNIEDRDYSNVEIYENWIIPTASVVFKKEILNSDIYQKAINSGKFRYGDIILFLSCCHYGKIRGFKDIMSVYRRLESGMVFQDNVNDHTTDLIQHHSEIPIIFGEKFKSPSRRQKTYVYLSAWNNHKRFLYVIKAFFNYPSFFIKLLLKVIKRNIYKK